MLPLPHLPRRPRRLPALALTALLLAASGPAVSVHAQEPDAEVRVTVAGRVVDAASGEPVARAMVSLEAADWGVFTDADGRFELADLRPGRHHVLAERLGYGSTSRTVEVGAEGARLTLKLDPRPVLLEGLSVVTDRFQRRRNATAVPVSGFDQSDLLSGTYRSVTDFIEGRAGVPIVTCPSRFLQFNCALVRGRPRPASVYIDEVLVPAGLDQLEQYNPGDLYLLEVYGRGAHVRAYTHAFVKYAARTRLHPIPLFF